MVIFSDLDGTLLDHDTYSYAQAEPSIAQLRKRGIPLILVTSKTRAEVEALRAAMGHADPFIVENGAAAIIPGGTDLIFGSSNASARRALAAAAADARVTVRGFGEMTVEEIAERSGLNPAVARLAAQREYGEPFVVLDGDAAPLEAPLARRGFQMTRGGRFFHVLGGCDKAAAVSALAVHLGDPDTAALGDAPNDIGMLLAVRRPILMPGRHLAALRAAVPAAAVAPGPGPEGWNRAVMALLT